MAVFVPTLHSVFNTGSNGLYNIEGITNLTCYVRCKVKLEYVVRNYFTYNILLYSCLAVHQINTKPYIKFYTVV